jgi:ferric iron reductase protein FhuF
MNNVILWSLWYGALVTLPLVMTRLLIKRSMVRVIPRRRLSSVKRYRLEEV